MKVIFLSDLLIQMNQVSLLNQEFKRNPVFIITIAENKVLTVPFIEEIDDFIEKHYEIYPYSRFVFLIPKKYLKEINGNVIVLERRRFLFFKKRYEVVLEF
jgi:hypothetical protein